MQEEGFFGKFRGVVAKNDDPLYRGRVRAYVPDVYGDLVSGWAEPCLPFTGAQMGFFAVPAVGAAVWMEFECGDPEFPIWTGGRWEDQNDMPTLPQGAQSAPDSAVLICTKGQSKRPHTTARCSPAVALTARQSSGSFSA